MCGIAGFTSFSDHTLDRRAVLAQMVARLAHRGPDGQGTYLDDHVALGHRRLSIIDIQGGAQPMTIDPSGRWQIVFNGEIYNYLELRRQLQSQGWNFRTQSDTEVLLACHVHYGQAALDRIDGMFAYAIWDALERKLLLVRDRIGIKPLFYTQVGGNLYFASELTALLQHPATPRGLSPLSVSKYFSLGYVPSPNTILQDVYKLEPGQWLTFEQGRLERGYYWDLPLADRPASSRHIEECAGDLLGLLRDSVRRHMRSDVPVGVFLSGGIDSSAITALASQLSPDQTLHSFSIGFENRSYDESPHALRVAQAFNTRHHIRTVTLDDVVQAFPHALGALDEPLADASILPTYLLCQLAKEHVKVVLGGDGGDELFAGYPAFQAHRVVQRLSFLPPALRDWANQWVRRLPVSHGYVSLGQLAQQLFKGLGMSPEVRFLLWMGCYSNAEKKRLFTADFQDQLLRTDPFEDVARLVRRSGLSGDLERLLYLCTKLYFQDGVLVKVDRASMAHGLEVRVPFMDRDLVEFASGIQGFYKLKGLTTKYVLKRSMSRLLPSNIIHRRKAGFMMPVAVWLADPRLGDLVRELCNPKALADTGCLDAAFVQQLLDEHFHRRHDHRKVLWPIIAFMAWWRRHTQR